MSSSSACRRPSAGVMHTTQARHNARVKVPRNANRVFHDGSILTSAKGQKQTFVTVPIRSALRGKADANQLATGCPLIAKSGHSFTHQGPNCTAPLTQHVHPVEGAGQIMADDAIFKPVPTATGIEIAQDSSSASYVMSTASRNISGAPFQIGPGSRQQAPPTPGHSLLPHGSLVAHAVRPAKPVLIVP